MKKKSESILLRNLHKWSFFLYSKSSQVIKNKNVNAAIRIIITILFFYIVNKSISYHDIINLSHSIKIPSLLAIFLAAFSSFYFQVVRWKLVLKSRDLPSSGTIPLKTMLWGNLLGFLTPGRIGELFRGTSIDPDRKIDSVFAGFIDRLFAIIMILLTGVLCMIIQIAIYKIYPPLIELIPLSILIIIMGTGIMLSKQKRFRSIELFQKGFTVLKYFRNLLNSKVILISMAAHFFFIMQTVLLLMMFGAPGWIANSIISGQAYMQMIFLPLFVANVGIREYSFVLYLKQFSINQDSEAVAFAVSSVILFINIILPALVGLIWIIFEKNNQFKIVSKKTKSDCRNILVH